MTQDTEPFGLASTEQLGQLPDHIRDELPDDLAAQRVQRWGDARVAAERERWRAALGACDAALAQCQPCADPACGAEQRDYIDTPRDDDSRAADGAAGLPVLYDMDCAPLDGTLVQLLVRFDNHAIEDTNESTWTIGSHNNGEWNFVGWCWHTDEWARGSGDLLGWLPVGPNDQVKPGRRAASA